MRLELLVLGGGRLSREMRRGSVVAVGLALLSGGCGEPLGGSGQVVTPTTSSVATTTTSAISTPSTVVIGDPAFVVVPDESGAVPPDLQVGCPSGPTFPVSALLNVEPLVGNGREQVEAAIAGFLESGEGGEWPQADEWQVLYESDTEVLLVFVDPPAIGFQEVELVAGEWRWAGSQLGEGCMLEARLPEGLNRVTWRIDPEVGLDPASTAVHLLATERECASGQPMGDRLHSPNVVITTGEVRITLVADPPPGDYQTCPGNPEAPVVIELGMLVGDRTVVDGLSVLGELADLLG